MAGTTITEAPPEEPLAARLERQGAEVLAARRAAREQEHAAGVAHHQRVAAMGGMAIITVPVADRPEIVEANAEVDKLLGDVSDPNAQMEIVLAELDKVVEAERHHPRVNDPWRRALADRRDHLELIIQRDATRALAARRADEEVARAAEPPPSLDARVAALEARVDALLRYVQPSGIERTWWG